MVLPFFITYNYLHPYYSAVTTQISKTIQIALVKNSEQIA